MKTSTGGPRIGPVLLVVSLYADQQDKTPLWTEQQAVTLDAAGRYSVLAGATLAEGLSKR